MSGIYAEDCDCDAAGRIGLPSLLVRRFASDSAACEALLQIGHRWYCGAPNVDPWTTGDCLWQRDPCHWHAGTRYHSIHGPGGHLLGVRP